MELSENITKRMGEMMKEYLNKALMILDRANIVFPKEAIVSIYHHLGKEYFDKVGAVFINIVNRAYCKSYVIMLPNQRYPNHYHKIKMESFYILHGVLWAEVNGITHCLEAGEMLHIDRGEDHTFWSNEGTVFEEISTIYTKNDSFYLDDEIQKTTYAQRRTKVTLKEWERICKEWGR